MKREKTGLLWSESGSQSLCRERGVSTAELTQVWGWMYYCMWLLVTADSPPTDPNDEGDLWAHKVEIQSRKLFRWVWFSGSVISESQFFCLLSLLLWQFQLPYKAGFTPGMKIVKLFLIPHCPRRGSGMALGSSPRRSRGLSLKSP